MTFSIDTCRSYATEAALMKGLERLGLTGYRPLVVRNREGRWTAVFGVSSFSGYLALAASKGFMTIG